MRWHHAALVLAIVVATTINVFCVRAERTDELGGGVHQVVEVGQGDHGRKVAEVDVYVKQPKPKPHPLKKDYPELFATEAVVISFGADWCGWCRAQARELRGPSLRYNILYVKVDEVDEKGERVPTRWGKLLDKLELGESVPVTVVIEKGKVTKTFLQFTPWADIKPHAKKAKKNETDETNHIDIGPIHIDWNDGVDIDINRHQRNRRRR